jgi:hypothetical protein
MSQQTNKISQSNNSKTYHNSDTFCNICKKELCNKYFLKTHLANKHGIILQNDDNNSNSLTPSTTTQNSSNQIPYSPKPTKVSSSSPNYTQNESDNDELNDDENTSDENNRSISQIEDFCELCKKQFCNKYYLKKHKLDVHGVLIENGIKSYKRISSESAVITTSNSTIPIITPSTTTTSDTTVNTTTNSSSSSINNVSTNSKNIQQQAKSKLFYRIINNIFY